MMLSLSSVSFFLGGGVGGGGDGVLSEGSSFVGEAATAACGGGDCVFLCFLQVLMIVYSSRFFNSIVRLIALRTDLSVV